MRSLERHPESYAAVERDPAAAGRVQEYLAGPRYRCLVSSAEDSGLSAGSATVVYGEAMLSMQLPVTKDGIVAEGGAAAAAWWPVRNPELCLIPDNLDPAVELARSRKMVKNW